MSAVIDLTLGDFDGDEMGEVNRQRTRIHSKDSAWTGPEFKTRVERVHISGAAVLGSRASTPAPLGAG